MRIFPVQKSFQRRKTMNKKSILCTALFLIASFLFLAVNTASAAEYDSLQGLKSFKAVIDVRSGKAKSLAMQLGLLHQMYKDANVRKVTESPEFVLVFIGPAVKLVSTKTEGMPDEDRETVAKIAETVTAMANDGIKFEICLFAVNVLGVDQTTILPEIKQVGNGWISLAGYQHQGYSLIPVY
jgi:intracellular sulfur oxidation DsrE/DsrF family protein